MSIPEHYQEEIEVIIDEVSTELDIPQKEAAKRIIDYIKGLDYEQDHTTGTSDERYCDVLPLFRQSDS